MLDNIRINNQEHSLRDVNPEQLQEWVNQCMAKFPLNKKYRVIYADPPWPYAIHYTNLQGASPFPSMTMEDLQNLPIDRITENNAALFLWCTNPMMPKALELMQSWGFEYKTVFKVWLKRFPNGNPVCNPGWWSRSSVELLLVGTKGSGILKNKTTNSEPQEYESVRERHSSKPMELTECVRDFLEVDSRLELFCRHPCPGFDCWGLETPGYFMENQECISRTEFLDNKVSRSAQTTEQMPLKNTAKRRKPPSREKANDGVETSPSRTKSNPAFTSPTQSYTSARILTPTPTPTPKPKPCVEVTWENLDLVIPPKRKAVAHKPDCRCVCCVARSKRARDEAVVG